MEPGVEPLDIAQCRQVAPGVDQGLLGRILREFGVTKDEPSCRVQPIDGAGGQDAEGLAVSASRPVNELRLHASLPSGVDDLPGIYTLSRRRRAFWFKVVFEDEVVRVLRGR